MPLLTVPGNFLDDLTLKVRATNRTGATVNKGDIIAFDLTGSDGDVDAYGTNELDPFRNFIAVATAHLNGWIFGVVADTSIVNDAEGNIIVRGLCDVELADSDTSAIAAGGTFTGTNAQTYASASADAGVVLGIALEAGVDTGATTKKCYFDGIQLNTHGG